MRKNRVTGGLGPRLSNAPPKANASHSRPIGHLT
jgi:hypothetical protein